MSFDRYLLLENMHIALTNHQYPHVQFLLEHAMCTAQQDTCPPFYEVGMGLHVGRLRAENEDCVLAMQGISQTTHEPFGLFVVCDGMGGHEHGQQAALLGAQTLLDVLWPDLLHGISLQHAQSLLANAIEQANSQIYQHNQRVQVATPRAFMGTTITALLLLHDCAYIGNVGDSRTYRFSNEELRQISKDHSVVAQLLAEGLLLAEEQYSHPARNRVTRALGLSPQVLVDTFFVPLSSNETFLLCSDGLWEMVRDREIAQVLAEMKASHIADQLIAQSNKNGGFDNISCIVVRLQQRQYNTSLIQSQVHGLALVG